MTPDASASPAPRHRFDLAHLPVGLFSTVMGTVGLAIAWKRATHALGMPDGVWMALAGFGTGLFALLLTAQVVRGLMHPAALAGEFRHPVKVNFFPAVSISLMLLAIVWADTIPVAARLLWLVGMALHLGFTLIVMSGWIHHTHYEIKHANPAWFIPVVGNIIVPVAGIHFAPAELSWFFFSVGVVFWLVLLSIVMNRLFFHEPLPANLAPTLFILLAPPSVGFVAYVGLTGGLDPLARVLYSVALFFLLLLVTNSLRFIRLPFFVSSWAFSFPLAAVTIAALVYLGLAPSLFGEVLAATLLTLTSAVIGWLTARTLLAAATGHLTLPH